MTLTLSVLRCPDAVTPETRTVGGGEFTIGRAPGNDWVLPDPDRHLSKRHCVLAYRAGGWQIADLSKNGTFLNGEPEPAGAAPRPLRDGDRLRLGAYEIEVRIEGDAGRGILPGPHPDPLADPFADPGFPAPHFAPPPGEEFGPAPGFPPAEHGLAAGFGADSFRSRGPDPFGRPARSGASARPVDPFPGPTQADHSPAIEDAFQPPRPVTVLPDDWDLDPGAPPSRPPGGREPEPSVVPPPAPPPVPAPQAHPSPRAADGDVLAAFLRGTGLTDAHPADPEAVMEALGAAFRALVSGLRQALIARAMVKSAFRIEQTMIRSRGNNPLKFSAGDDDALAALLGTGRRTDMGPAEAVAEALRDIRLHELASVAAMQSAVHTLLDQFDPAAIRAQAEGGGLALVPAQRKARAWDAFEVLHARISQALADDFDSVFGKAFARAYEQALRDISARERE